MFNVEADTETAGAYIFHEGYFIFAFGFGSNLNSHELGVIRIGGHREDGETVKDCVRRETKEETSLNCKIITSNISYHFDGKNYLTLNNSHSNAPIFITERNNNKLSVMYLAQSDDAPTPSAETQGLLLLRQQDIKTICENKITFKDYINIGGKYILTDKLKNITDYPSKFTLTPKAQIKFLNYLFELEPKLIKALPHQ